MTEKRHLHIEIDNDFRKLLRTAVSHSNFRTIKDFVKNALLDKMLITLRNHSCIDETLEAIDKLEELKMKENL